jgi:uncharacterized membrane protein (UPF0127 family)
MDKKFWFQLAGLAIVILAATFFAFNRKTLIPFTSQFIKPTAQTVDIETEKQIKIVDPSGNIKAIINAEMADTPEKRTKGLGYRDSLATDSGMFFNHENTQKYTYWMKGMRFPIDIMWILDDEIVDLIQNVPAPVQGQSDDTLERYSSVVPVNNVLETNAGFVQKFGISPGDKIILEDKSK